MSEKLKWLDLAGNVYGKEDSYVFFDTQDLGISTLRNLGNTCFFNSVIQCLAHSPKLVSFILQGSYPKTDSLWREFTNLVMTMKENNYRLSPHDFYVCFATEKRKYDHDQEDAHEILFYLLSKFHDCLIPKIPPKFRDFNENKLVQDSIRSLNQTTKMSPIFDLFGGQFYQRLKCKACKKINHNTNQTFTGIELDINNNPDEKNKYTTLMDLFKNYCAQETLEDCWNCEHCGAKGVTAIKKTNFFRLPKYLIVTFKRFDFFHQRGHKNQKLIDYPLEELDLTPFVGYPNPSKKIYDLYAGVYHVGSTLQAGHYYSICKVNDNWLELNDQSLSHVLKADDVVNPKAYILFYKQRNLL